MYVLCMCMQRLSALRLDVHFLWCFNGPPQPCLASHPSPNHKHATHRILGLDRLVVGWVKKWKESRMEQRQSEVMAARESLEELFSRDKDGDNDPGEGG